MSGVHCAQCSTDNPANAKFCLNCGAPQAARCPGCGVDAQPGARFCVECGSKIDVGASPDEGLGSKRAIDQPAEPQQLGDERRKASVLFADLSGYTAIAERLDPENTKALIDRALGRLGREVVERGGHIDKFIGDNVMAIFGAPVAHEDDPERAVRAGLAMQEAMKEINAEIASRESSKGIELALRVGINSGEVLAGRVGDQYTVTGDTVNVASRLQSASRPGAVTVGASTRRSTAAAIEYRELEPLHLKGKSQPMPAWEAVGVARPSGRAGRRPFAAPLMGRAEELARLHSLLERVGRESRPHLVTVLGEPGVGKSRLLQELANQLKDRAQPVETLIGRSPAYGTATTYAALGEIIRERFAISDGEPVEISVEKLVTGIERLGTPDQEFDSTRTANQIARILGIDAGGESSSEVDPEEVRDRIFASVRLLVELLSRSAPVVIAIEDIHWADEGMLDLIEHLAERARSPALIVCLARDELLERRPSWGGDRGNATTIPLDPLSAGEAEHLVRALLAAGAADGEVVEAVARRSGGNPLFAEEMLNRLREEGSGDVDELPESVHAVIAARLDVLGATERQLLQAASVIGQRFWEQTVGELTGEASIAESLATLVAKDLVAPSPTPGPAGEREFGFKHALVRDVAYSTLPRAVRARRHYEVARIIEDRAGTVREGVAALLAEHYGRAAELAEKADFEAAELARMRTRAARASAFAGDVAASLYSNSEAMIHFDNALRLAVALDSEELAQVEESRGDAAFRMGNVDAAIEAWSRAQASHLEAGNNARTGELHRKIGSGLWQKGDRESSIAHLQRGIDLLKDGEPCRELVELYEEAASLYVETGDNMLAIYAAEKVQRLAEVLGQSSASSRAQLIFGRVFGRIGDFAKARKSLEHAVELAHQADLGATIRALLTLSRHLETAEADYEAAKAACAEGISLADQLGDVPAQIELQAALGQVAVYPADWRTVEQHADTSARLAEREGLAGQLCLPLLLKGILAWQQGDWGSAESCLERSHSIAMAGGRSETASWALLWLGAGQADHGDHGVACATFAQAGELCDRAGLIALSAEALGARAVVLALRGDRTEARQAAAAVLPALKGASHPVGLAAAATAEAALATDPEALSAGFREAVSAWERAGRPIDAARAQLTLARLLRDVDPRAAVKVLEQTVAEAERLDLAQLATAGREELARV